MTGRRGLMVFCLVLFVSILLPTAAMANKRLYKANIKDPGNRRVAGNAVIMTTLGSVQFMAFVGNVNSSVTEVWLVDPQGANLVPLCGKPDAPVPVCEFDANGNLGIDGAITNTLLYNYHVDGAQMFRWLDNGELGIVARYTGGSGAASGIFLRMFP